MDRPDDLEQRLWEFVYELLPEDEAEALRPRIAAEADVARLHAEVRRKAAILAQAVRLKLPPIPLVQPAASVRASSRRWTNWAVALAASLLLCYLGFAGFRTRALERSVALSSSGTSWAEQPVRAVLFGSPALQPKLANYFAVQTQTAAGTPRAAVVDYRLIGDDGTLLSSGQCQSDASGFAPFNFLASPPSSGLSVQQSQNFHLELEPQTDLTTVMVRCTLPMATRELTTYVSADKTIYRPGERVRCRSVTLGRADLEVVREVPVEFRILDAAGQPLNGVRQEKLSRQGVAFAEFELPRFQPGGRHTLVASSPTDAFPEARHEFQVRPYATATLRQKPNFARDSDGLGDEVEADLRVEFFPESGELVQGVANRVYFFAHDTQEKPVHIQGRVVDSQGGEVAAVQTIHDGRGVFGFPPQLGHSYRLELDSASGSADRRDLPPVSERQFLVLEAVPGVFAAGQPLKVRLLTNSKRPVAVSAVCRGVVVGQELVSPAVFQRESSAGGPEVVVPVAETAEGVIRLTAYDYSVQPPTPVAERLVFRRPVRKLSIQSSQDASRHEPGDSVQLAFSVQDEFGRPISAVLGASVVDEAALSLVRDRSASLTTHFWLTGQIDDVRGLEDANLYLAEGLQAEQALDLLLGTQGWRRFVSLPVDQLTQSPIATQAEQARFTDLDSVSAAVAVEPSAPTVLADNAGEAADILRSGLASLQTGYEQTVRRVGRFLIVGSLILAVMLGLLALMRRLPATTVWMPAMGTSAMCLVLGTVWLATERLPTQEIAKVSVVRADGQVQVAQVDERTAAFRLNLQAKQRFDETDAMPLRKKSAQSVASRPAPANPALADMEAVQAPAEPAGAIQAPLAAPAPAQPVPAAAPMLPAATELKQMQTAPLEARAETPVKELMPRQLPFPEKAEWAAGARPAMAAQIASDAAPSPGGPGGGMGGAGYAFGGGTAAGGSRDSNVNQDQKAAEKAASSSANPLPAIGLAPTHPPETADGLAESKSLSQSEVRSESVSEQQLFRQYARRSLAEFGADGRSAPMETVYWEPFLPTDAQGRATFQFRLPDTATTYRVLVDGHAQGRIGSHLGRIVVKPETASGAK